MSKATVTAEYRTLIQFESEGTEALEALEDTAWDIFSQIEHSELDWDIVVNRYVDGETH